MEENFIKVGFAKVDITPPLGACLAGYLSRRDAVGILDSLYASAIAVSDGENRWILISCDLISVGVGQVAEARKLIKERIGLSSENVMIHTTHIHTGPIGSPTSNEQKKFADYCSDNDYLAMLVRKLADVAQMAADNMKDASVEVGYGEERSISFIRRFRMKDGTVRTNPGIGNPDILEPIGEIDPSVGVIRFKFAEGDDEILIVNFALHSDIVTGNLISADYPGHMRRAVSKQLPSSEVLFINGACGDINHINPMKPGTTSGGYGYAQKVGNILAAEVLKVYQRMTRVTNTPIGSATKIVKVPLRRVSAEEVDEANKFLTAWQTGEWKSKDMRGTTAIARAYKTLSLAKSGGFMEMELQVLALGDLAFVGLPGEVFVDIGNNIKASSPYPNTFISELSNGSYGYFPTSKAFSEGGYESRSSSFTPELEDILVDTALELANKLR